MIKKVVISNYKNFGNPFTLNFQNNNLIIVGQNEAGKSTILEAIHLATTGLYRGKPIYGEISQYLFNSTIVDNFLKALKTSIKLPPPEISIELFFDQNDPKFAEYFGSNNSTGINDCGFTFKISISDNCKEEYAAFVKNISVDSLPVEYYEPSWVSFAGTMYTPRSLPIRSTLIDASAYRYQNGTDMYVSRIIKDLLDSNEVINLSQAHRNMQASFQNDQTISNINKRLNVKSILTKKSISLSVDLGSKSAWEGSVQTDLDNLPFHLYGKGTQTMIKTELAMGSKAALKADLILIEEPENHLSHTNLNAMLDRIRDNMKTKQCVITTHSSFVANKLNLEKLVLLDNNKVVTFQDLKAETKEFFERLPGYDTLRYLLCAKAILVEGPSDELLIQKAYMAAHGGKLPIEDLIDVISVGTSFLRFLELAMKTSKRTIVVTDNDGSIESVKQKYDEYIQPKPTTFININYDEFEDNRSLSHNGKSVNFNSLEACMIRSNGLDQMNIILGKNYTNEEDLLFHMQANKTESALKIFLHKGNLLFPDYIKRSVS